jgi:ribosomal protein L15
MMANDINALNSDATIEELASKYSTFIATLNSGKHGKINAVDVTCNYCKKGGHTEAECHKKKREGGGGGGGSKGGKTGGGGKGDKKNITCFNCGKKGHMKKDCNSAPKEGAAPTADAGGDKATKKAMSATISDTQVADLMSRLKSGEIKLPCSLALVSPKQHSVIRNVLASNPGVVDALVPRVDRMHCPRVADACPGEVDATLTR